MSVDYGFANLRSKTKHNSKATAHLKTLVEDYKGDEVDILSEGVYDVVRDQVAFQEYVERLSEGTSEETAEQLAVLSENTRMVMLQESMIGGVNPIAALSLPMLRIGYPKMAVREGLPTEPVEQPKFKVTTKRPYVLDTATGEKHWLPGAFHTKKELFGLPRLQQDAITVPSGGLINHNLLAPISKNALLGDEIDPRFTIVEVTDSHDVAIPVSFELDTNLNAIVGSFVDSTSTAAQVLGKVDRSKGLLTLVTVPVNAIKKVKIQGYVSSEMNNAATQVGFDIDGVDITIGTGQPIESPINIQQMTDVMAMYNVDSTLTHMETMSTALAQSTDLEGVQFIYDCFDRNTKKIQETFDAMPPSNFLAGPVEWRKNIHRNFDRLVSQLQTEFNIYTGHAVVFCHPLDAQVVADVRWMYTNTEQPNDVAVDFRVGTYTSGTTTYVVLQSPNFVQGHYEIVYIPSEADFKSLVYYPYAFNVIRGAASPNTPNLPAIQMIKRYRFQKFNNMVARLNIVNNGVGEV